MDVSKEIREVFNLLDEALAIVPEHDLMEQYKSRLAVNYAQALKLLLEVQRGEKGWLK